MGKMPPMPQPPAPTLTDTYQDDKLVSAQYLRGNKIINKMISSKEEQENKKRREEDIAALENDMQAFLPTLNTLDPQFQADITKEAENMTEAAQRSFQSEFQPIMKDIQEEAGKKFGTLNSSFYQDEKQKLMDIAAETEADIAKDVQGRKSELKQQELANRRNWYDAAAQQLNYLKQGVNDFYNQQSQKYEQTLKSSDMYNNFNAQNYQTKMQGYQAQLQYKAQRTSALLGLFSDERLKENIVPIKDALDKLDKLRGCEFDWIAGGHDLGVIAQEVKEVFPELVKESDELGGLFKVNYIGLIPVLLQAIKELNAKVERLENNG